MRVYNKFCNKFCKLFFVFLLNILLVLFTSCATTFYYDVERPAQMDLHGASSISILPFRVEYYGNDFHHDRFFPYYKIGYSGQAKYEFADYITSELTKSVLRTGYFTVIDSSQVESCMRYGNEIPCDVFLSGYISNWDSKIEKDENKSSDTVETVYRRVVLASVIYQVIGPNTNQVLNYNRKNFSEHSSWENMIEKLPSADKILRSSADRMIEQIMKEIQPYTVTNRIELVSSSDKEDAAFKNAIYLAKSGCYEAAELEFLALYKTYGNSYGELYGKSDSSIRSGYNAAVMQIVQKRYGEAKLLLEDVWSKSNTIKINENLSKKIQKAYQQCKTEISYQEKISNNLILRQPE